MLDKYKNKRSQRLCYNINQWRVKGGFEILNDISENVTLVQLMDTVGNVNHVVGIVLK